MGKTEKETEKAKTLIAKADTKDASKELKIESKAGETKKEFITRLGRKVCGDDFKLPVVY